MLVKAENYRFSVIEDPQVPLSAGFADRSGLVVPVVLICIAIALMIMYSMWYRAHRKRIASLMVMGLNSELYINGVEDVSMFHPFRTMRIEKELENRVVEGTVKGV